MNKRTVKVVLVIILIVFSAAYMLNSRVDNQNFDYQGFFKQHEDDMEILARKFFEVGSLKSMRRHEALVGEGLTYGFSVRDDSSELNVSYEIDTVEKEESFWKMDAKVITSTKGTGKVTFKEILEKVDCEKDVLKFLITKMKECDVESIGVSNDGTYIKMYVSNKFGYIYFLDANSAPVYSEGISMNESWEFFDE